MSALDEIKRLEYLSLVSKVCTELENHLGICEKDLGNVTIHDSVVFSPVQLSQLTCYCYLTGKMMLTNCLNQHEGLNTSCPFILFFLFIFTAEFIISLADKHPTFEEFKAVLCENGADFTVSSQLTEQTPPSSCLLFCFFISNVMSFFFRTPSLATYLGLLIPCDPHHLQVKVQRAVFHVMVYHIS